MDLEPDPIGARYSAMRFATELHQGTFDNRGDMVQQNINLLSTADACFRFLGGPIVFTLIIGPIVDQSTGRPTGNVTKGSPVQLHDNEKVTFSVAESDAKGFDVPDDATTTADDVSWTVDNASIGALTVSTDTRSCDFVAGSVGSGILTVATGGLSATVAIDVLPAGAVALTVTAGAVTPQ